MSARFYCSEIGGQTAQLDDAESHHALHVLRLPVGDKVELFDGTGATACATIAEVTRKTISLTVSEHHPGTPLQRPQLVVAAAPPRGDRFKAMVEKLTELGVDEFIPLRTVRSVVDPRQSKLDKLQSTVIGAMKQSGRNRLMTIHESMEFSVVLRQAATKKRSIQIAHPGEASAGSMTSVTADTVLLIGPEGGFTREEVLQATDYSARRIVWPDSILRIETAAVAFAGLLLNQMHRSV